MLNIYFGNMDGIIYDPASYFNNTYDDNWMQDEIVKEIVKDIDGSEILGNGVVSSPVLGLITPKDISGGAKMLILILHDDEHVFNATMCGNNCAKWLLKLGELKDITVNLKYIMHFPDEEFSINVLNTGKCVHSMSELLDAIEGVMV